MNLSTYTLDVESIRLNSYRLLCLFYANKEIARLSNPEDRSDPASRLESDFFPREMTQLLINISIGLRVLDDQMKLLPADDPNKISYGNRLRQVNSRCDCMMFDTMTLREVCNKVIHATVVKPHSTVGSQTHQIDEQNWHGYCEAVEQSPGREWEQPDPIHWEHLSAHVRLGGTQKKEQWWHLLEVPIFVDAVSELLQPQPMSRPTVDAITRTA